MPGRTEVHLHFRLPRKRWLVLIAFAVALAIGVPIAWASFNDVPPGDPFIPDINAIQGAGITSGCGGGNFCPSANITREAEAAFTHRGEGRVAQSTTVLNNQVPPLNGFPTEIGSVSIDVGGVTGGTQFVKVESTMTTFNDTTPPLTLNYFIALGDCTGTGDNKGPEEFLDVGNVYSSASLLWTKAVPSGQTSTFVVCGWTTNGITGITGLVLDATTFPFGSTGGSTLTATPTKTHP